MDEEDKDVREGNQDHGMDGRSIDSDPGSSDEKNADNEYFIKKAVLRNFEVSINGIKPGNPAEMLEKLYSLRGNDNMTNEEKIEQVRRIILEYME